MRIGVDLMGSDASPKDLFKAVTRAAVLLPPAVEWLVFSPPSTFSSLDKNVPKNISFFPSGESISHEDDPRISLRKKRMLPFFWELNS